jgi:AcrR family transcriptional regulator
VKPTLRSHNSTAAERREALIEAAITEFALKGLHGTAIEDIARRVGISQPYVFRLFGTKKDLFIAASDRVYDRIVALFTDAAGTGDGDVLKSMALGYFQLLSHREELLMLLQMFAAAGDPEVQRAVGARYQELFDRVQEAARTGPDEVRAFFAQGMLITVVAALDLPRVLGYASWEVFNQECARLGIRGRWHDHLLAHRQHAAEPRPADVAGTVDATNARES